MKEKQLLNAHWFGRIALAIIFIWFGLLKIFGPLIFLPEVTWQKFLMFPTLEGQYILKNVALLALGYIVYVIHVEKSKSKN